MSGNIQARETLQLLLDYPIREYPEEIEAKGLTPEEAANLTVEVEALFQLCWQVL